ncbi:dihydroxyacetone kinase phosphoryl donor subunit DhaM [Pseudonocardia charpentierae]|uniref:phosphoenolpyruvate--glycerone phosphotransferase n=1 Tax=Pseudonocardia charpentierae TaxID=3075545 RepID=A0ABU2NAY2_9PSEU|nr:dihydroxyacetone kinase phosphoryl donor subunit DhaM [Pseudonocardia sp. DSM 45834]MDT0350198.1 dihydroxyacetone kinase phosphoryl donor subunit DhaM [Pseudonocardia sp. DSM 45834]
MSTPETTPSVGIVVVSHSRALGNAAVELAREVIGDVDVPIAVAAGLDEITLGTDAAAIATAIATSDRGAGVVVLMDLGSAVLSAELALDLLEDVGADPATRGRTVLSAGPLVEGLVVAAATASTGADRHQVSADAAAALGPKRSHLGLSWEPTT